MDVAEAASPGVGAWAAIRGYFTPATLFLVVNIVIGTIALTSRTHQRRRRQVYQYHHDGEILHHDQLQPPPPLLHQQYYGGGEHQQMMMQETLYAPPPAPAPLARTSSVLDRLRSFTLYSFRSGDLATDDIPADAAAAATPAQAHYGRTRSEPAREQNKKAKKQAASEAKTMTKSSSEARKDTAAEDADDGGVDARADDFINKFRQQLQLQRLNSLLNYKEMLNRGSSKQ